MDDELLELQRQFESAQQAKSSIRLSERNVVELVQKLHELHIIDFDLLHTVSGKEYITPDQLRHEIVAEVKKLGRISLIDLADATGVDLYHVEKQAQLVVSDYLEFMFNQGEIISHSYWDNVAEEINERLQECSQIALAEIAAQLNVGSELVASMLEARLGSLVKGRLEGGQLYTPAYVARVSAMVRGAARGITVPTNLAVVWGTLQQLLQEMNGAGGVTMENSFFQSLFNGLVKEGEVIGSLRAGVHWTPTVFAIAQKKCLDSFFSQNSFISYDTLNKLGISQPVQFLQSRYPEGIPLATAFGHPSLIEMLETAVEDAVERGSWIDSLSVLPSSFESQDASKLLSLCPSVQSAVKSNKGLILGDSYVFSNAFVKFIYDSVEKEMDAFSLSTSSGAKLSGDLNLVKGVKNDSGRSSDFFDIGNEKKKKKGKSSGTKAAEIIPGDEDYIPTKSKKTQRKGKGGSSVHASDTKPGAKNDLAKIQDYSLDVPSEEWVMQKILTLVPDFEEQGIEDPLVILRPLASYMRPMLINYLKERRRKALSTENTDNMKRLLDDVQKKLDESFLTMQLYERALDLFEDDQSTSVVLHRHLLRTVATSITDTLFHHLVAFTATLFHPRDKHNKLKSGIEVEESQSSEPAMLSPSERTTIAKSFPGSFSKKALTVVEALEGKRVEVFTIALKELAEESGFVVKMLDKKLERTLLHKYRKDLIAQVATEMDPVTLLPKVVSLLYIQAHNKALQAPGRAISTAISHLKDKLEDSAHKILTEYQNATVNLLTQLSSAAGDDEESVSDIIMSKREFLENLMPALKGLALNPTQLAGKIGIDKEFLESFGFSN